MASKGSKILVVFLVLSTGVPFGLTGTPPSIMSRLKSLFSSSADGLDNQLQTFFSDIIKDRSQRDLRKMGLALPKPPPKRVSSLRHLRSVAESLHADDAEDLPVAFPSSVARGSSPEEPKPEKILGRFLDRSYKMFVSTFLNFLKTRLTQWTPPQDSSSLPSTEEDILPGNYTDDTMEDLFDGEDLTNHTTTIDTTQDTLQATDDQFYTDSEEEEDLDDLDDEFLSYGRPGRHRRQTPHRNANRNSTSNGNQNEANRNLFDFLQNVGRRFNIDELAIRVVSDQVLNIMFTSASTLINYILSQLGVGHFMSTGELVALMWAMFDATAIFIQWLAGQGESQDG